MKILLLEPCHVGFGGYFRAFNIAESLANKGHEVTLIVSSPDSWGIKKRLINQNLLQIELPRKNITFFINGRMLRGFLGLYYAVIKKFDIIHIFVPVQIESLIPAIFLSPFKSNMLMDWDDYWEGSYIYKNLKLIKIYVKVVESTIPRVIKNYTVASDFLGRLAYNRGCKRVLKLINCLPNRQVPNIKRSAAAQLLGLSQEYVYIIAIGNTYTKERALELVKFCELIPQNLNLKVITNISESVLLSEANSVTTEFIKKVPNLISLGYLNQDRLDAALNLAKFSIFISGDFDNERANFPIRIGTYVSGNTFVLMNNINSEANKFILENGFGVVKNSVPELIEWLINNYHIPIYTCDESMKIKFTWDFQCNSLVSHYNEIIQAGV